MLKNISPFAAAAARAEARLERVKAILGLDHLPVHACAGGAAWPVAWATIDQIEAACGELVAREREAEDMLLRLNEADWGEVADAMGVGEQIARLAGDVARRHVQDMAARVAEDRRALVMLGAHAIDKGAGGGDCAVTALIGTAEADRIDAEVEAAFAA